MADKLNLSQGDEIELVENDRGEVVLKKARLGHLPNQVRPEVLEAFFDIFDKSAALLESVVKNHCFYNGNKRTAYLVTKSFLILNGYYLRMKREPAVEFIVDIAKKIVYVGKGSSYAERTL
ncbi:type II toxin-antitoxin system death-on-curing family toxin [Paenibacillus sp. 22594]|uniref:type II toxin-antitoxin system death-on-curing family toxin n=1 Tax=Paenibacillus sp. 22594 TaxID=3453947 RepID=UPI003F838FA0